MINPNTVNELDKFLDQEIIRMAKLNANEIESVSFGRDSGCGYKNDIFVSFACTTLEGHGSKSCMCRDVLNQQRLTELNINIELAEKIAHYVSGLIGGKRVYRG